jgi:hypothetical protein
MLTANLLSALRQDGLVVGAVSSRPDQDSFNIYRGGYKAAEVTVRHNTGLIWFKPVSGRTRSFSTLGGALGYAKRL